jgi:dephospho-CoA kinase
MNNLNFKSEFIKKNAQSRIYQMNRPIIAITGGIASGKSTFCKILKDKYHFEIVDADQLVKKIYQLQHVKNKIAQLAPSSIKDGEIDFSLLRTLFFNNKQLQQDIENIIYQELPSQFMHAVNNSSQTFVIYDVPLLFEKNLHGKMDLNLLVYASPLTQKARIKQRDKSSDEVIEAIIQKQIPIVEKRKMADLIIENNSSSLQQLELMAESFYQKYFSLL